mgnify:CR=1 FL=1
MKPNYVRIYGHRGARGDYPENTIEGFEYLFSTGVKAFEFDVLIAKDSIPVLVHDFRLNISNTRDAQGQWLLNRDQKVNQMTSQELQQYDVGSINPSSSYGRRFKDQKQLDNIRIPTLAKLFELLNQNANKDVFLNLEIKSTPVEEGLTPKPNEMVQLILNEIKKSNTDVCEIANDNAIGQIIVSGSVNSINSLKEKLKLSFEEKINKIRQEKAN